MILQDSKCIEIVWPIVPEKLETLPTLDIVILKIMNFSFWMIWKSNFVKLQYNDNNMALSISI